MAGSVDAKESRPRLANRQQHRPNIQAQDCSDYLCVCLMPRFFLNLYFFNVLPVLPVGLP